MSDFNPEHAWDTCDSGKALIDANWIWSDIKSGSRKVSLLVIAHARLVWPEIVAVDANYYNGRARHNIDRCEHALNVCERSLEEDPTDAESDAIVIELEEINSANNGPLLSRELNLAYCLANGAWQGWFWACSVAMGDYNTAAWDRAYAALLREIFGNPHRPVRFDPAWRTDTAVAIARQMHDSREFSAMPILADALQDAGCDSNELLNHCRSATATHVRGCWAVDLVLGKG